MTLDELADLTCTLAGAWLPGREDSVFPIADGYSDKHQQEMYHAITSGSATAILNTNPTGGGKTLSWAAPVIRSQEQTETSAALATYPTRALVRDQQDLLLSYFRRYFEDDEWTPEWSVVSPSEEQIQLEHESGTRCALSDRVQIVTGAGPTDPNRTTTGFQRAEQAITRGEQVGLPTIVLTTPDALTLLATGRYSDRDLGALPSLVDLIVIDEFHLTNPRGKRLLPFHLDTYLSLGRGPLEQVVFLSATPSADYVERITRSMDTIHVTREVTADPPAVGRHILPEATLGVVHQPLFHAGEWLSNHVADVEEFVAPPGQTLIIVDSVREVEVLAHSLRKHTSYDVGRVYGWKKEGRTEAIEESDIVVGNTAVEVGIDFTRVNRLIFAAHDPNSALQRLGRMRAQERFNDYRALCITTPAVQDRIYERSADGHLTRPELEQIFFDEFDTPGARRPYDDLCATYARYLWSEADPSLNEMYVPAETLNAYKSLVYTHFGSELEQLYGQQFTADSLWQTLEASEYLGRDEVMDELHTYRGSSLSCVVIDTTDETEPLKQYNLQHVLRYYDGEIIPTDALVAQFESVTGRSLTTDEQAYLEQVSWYSECGFIVSNPRDTPRTVGAQQLGWKPTEPTLTIARNLRITASPSVTGQQHLAPLATDVLVYYTPMAMDRARRTYGLGPYANVFAYRGGSLFLWEDALLAHSAELAEQLSQ